MKRYKRAASLGWCHILIPSQLVIGAADEDVGLAVVVSTGGHSFLAIDSLCCCTGDNLSECHGDAIISKTSNPEVCLCTKTTNMEVYSSSQNHLK